MSTCGLVPIMLTGARSLIVSYGGLPIAGKIETVPVPAQNNV